MIKKIKNLKLKPQLIFMTIMFAICTVLIGTFLFLKISEILSQKMTTATQQVFDHMEKELLIYFKTIENTSNTINYIPSTQQLLTQKTASDEYSYNKQVDSYVNSLFFINEHIAYVYLMLDYRTFSYGTTNIDLEHLHMKNLKKNETYISQLLPYGNVNLTETRASSKNDREQYHQLYAVTRRLYNAADPVSDHYYGNLVLVLDRRLFNDICSRYGMTKDAKTFIINNHNEIIGQQIQTIDSSFQDAATSVSLPNNQAGIFDVQGVKYVTHMKNIEALGWRIVTFTPYLQYFNDIYRISLITFFLFLILSVFMLLFTRLIISNIATPVKSMLLTMREVKAGNLRIRNTITLENEIGELSSYFNTMMDEVYHLTQNIFQNQQKLYEVELANKDARLLALQAQINPHFLYNTLATIESIAAAYHAVEVSQMTQALARIFRYSIKDDDFVLLSAEIENLRNYIFIHQVKVRNRFEFIMNISPDILNCKMMKLILQPLIENAINHGIMKKPNKCSLVLNAYKHDNHICFEIIDEGAGISKEKVETLNHMLSAPVEILNQKTHRQNIGLMNVKQRLSLCYAEQHNLYIESTLGIGTKVVLKIPFVIGDEL